MSMVTLNAICDAFGITMAQFFSEDNLVELTPERREVFDKWSTLTCEQKCVLWQLMKSYDAK